MADEQPHKCPVCNGTGIVYGFVETGTMPTTKCHPCDGSGVLWRKTLDEPDIKTKRVRPVYDPGIRIDGPKL